MRISEMKAKDNGREVRILVSSRMRNDSGNGEHLYGYWYCIKGGSVAFFAVRRPYSGCKLQNLEDDDIFNVTTSIDSKEEFARLLSL